MASREVPRGSGKDWWYGMTEQDKDILEKIIKAEGCCLSLDIPCYKCPLLTVDCSDVKLRKVWAMEMLAEEELDKMLKGMV